MGFYGDQVLPRFIDVMLANKEFAACAEEACAGLTGDVVEVGFGSGLNLRYLPPGSCGVSGRRPVRHCLETRGETHRRNHGSVEAAGLDGARIDAPDDRFDATLSTIRRAPFPMSPAR